MGHFQVRQVLVYQRVHRFFLGFWWSISQLSRGDDVILEKVTGYLVFGGEVPFKSWDSHGSQFRETDPVNHDRVTTGIRTGFRTASQLHDSIHIPISPISVGFSQLDMIHIRHSNVPGWMSTPNVTAVKIYRGGTTSGPAAVEFFPAAEVYPHLERSSHRDCLRGLQHPGGRLLSRNHMANLLAFDKYLGID